MRKSYPSDIMRERFEVIRPILNRATFILVSVEICHLLVRLYPANCGLSEKTDGKSYSSSVMPIKS